MPTAPHAMTPGLGSYEELRAAAEATPADATPLEVDTLLAESMERTHRARSQRESQYATLHRLAGDKQHYLGRNREWGMSHAEAEQRAAEQAEHMEAWDRQRYDATVGRLDALAEEVRVLAAATAHLDAIWETRRWSRFFIVTSSNGHIHSNMGCSTCRLTTTFGWLPNLSGQTEAEAVADQGPLLCTVCFPTAPTAWTIGREKPAGCPGSNKQPVEGTTIRRGMTTYGACPVCGQGQTVTMSGIRKHKPAKGA